MTLKGDAEFKRNLTRGLKKGIWLIFMRVAKSLKICTMIGSFFPKHIKTQMKKYTGVMSDDIEE